jgi:hypothetical protein
MPRIERVGLILVNDTGHTSHVDGDVHRMVAPASVGLVQGTVEIE